MTFKQLVDSIVDKIIDFSLNSRMQKLLQPFTESLYKLYERYLYRQIIKGPIPQHIAIIPDGNRRWARKHGLDPKEGHRHGYEKLKEVLSSLYDLGVKVVTIYAMSHENCLFRSEEEKENLFNLVRKGLEELMSEGIIDKYKVRVRIIGKLELVRKDVIELAKKVEQLSAKYSDRVLNIALCYGGRQEIVEAIKSIVKDALQGKIKVEDISEELVSRYVSTSHLGELAEPDLVIRTSGEMRISNFLLWQIAYSELFFCDVYWPDFRKIDLYRAIRSYQNRERRFGR